MRILDRYILREVLKGSLMALLVLLALLNFFTFADELRDLGEGDYGLKQIFLFLALNTPHSFYDLMPSAALLGSLVTLGALANHRELVAMQGAGASKWRIIGAVLKAGLVLAVLASVVGEYVSPVTERAAQLLKATATHEQVASRTKYGFWLRDSNVYINVRRIGKDGELGDISIYWFDEHNRLTLATHADRAVYQGEQWSLDTIRRSRFEGDTVVPETLPTLNWSSVLAPELLNVFVVRPENLSAWDLWNYMTYLKENGQKSLSVELAFWQRIVGPCLTLVMLLVAVPFVMTHRRETGIGQRIVIGVTLGLGFYLLDRMFGHIGLIYEMNPLLAAAAPTTLVFVAAATAIARLR